jgi:ParB family transcriptional regulator, chromosome partitioning protein
VTRHAPHHERLLAVAGAASGKRFAIGGARGDRGAAPDLPSRVHLFDAKGKALASVEVGGAVTALGFARGDVLLVGLHDGRILAFTERGDGLVSSFDASAHEGTVRGWAGDATGARVVSVGADGVLVAWSVEEGRLVELDRRALGLRGARALAVDPKTDIVAVGSEDGRIHCVPLDQLGSAPVREMVCGEGGIGALAFTDDGRVIAGCGDGSIRLCFLEGAVDEEDRSRDAGHEGAVTALILGPATLDEHERPIPRRLLSVGADGVVKCWPLDSNRKPRTLEVGSAAIVGATHLVAGRAKPERRGGILVVIDDRRGVGLVPLSENLEFGEVERLRSDFDRLREDLSARKHEVREAAVRTLATLVEDDARRLLDQALRKDEQPAVRRLAAEAIAESGRRLGRPALREALNDDDAGVRAAALSALGRLEADAPLQPLRAALRSRHADIRAEAVTRLPALREVSPLVPGLVADQLSDGDAKVRERSLEALFALEAAGSLVPVRTALAKGPPDVRAASLRRLVDEEGRVAPSDEARAVLQAAMDDEDEGVRRDAFFSCVASSPRLASKLSQVDRSIAKALGRVLDARAVAALPAIPVGVALEETELEPLFAAVACRHADAALRGSRALAVLGDSRASGLLLQLSREPDPGVRRQVVAALLDAALTMPTDRRSIARLEWLLDDPETTVRAASFEALQRLGEPDGDRGALDLAALALGCAHQDIRVRALQLLVEFGEGGKRASAEALREEADGLLGDALDDEDPAVRAEAFRTLWVWNAKTPQAALERAGASRHADIRGKVVAELERLEGDWAADRLIELVSDTSAEVGLAAYRALTESKKHEARTKIYRVRSDVHLAALDSLRPDVRIAGCLGARRGEADALRKRLIELVEDEHPGVHTAAIEAVDVLLPDDQQAFALAFSSKFYGLRVRAAELCGKRRDPRAIEPMQRLLRLPESDRDRPTDELRQRAARAVADVGAPEFIRYYEELLDDADGIVREMGARGLASACRPGQEQPLLDALSHGDLAVRSWAAEGLARLGDARAVPVLAGTLRHEHRPIRLGAILSLVTLGPDGVRGILQGLDDPEREIQDLVFAVIVARDVALARAGLPPDLLLSALGSTHPEIRFAAARALEVRTGAETIEPLAQELVGPRKPERANDEQWPAEPARLALLNVVVGALASAHPGQRYAAVRVLALRAQPEAYWREAARLRGPSKAAGAAPFTSWDDETLQPRKRGWIRELFTRAARPAPKSGTERVLTVLRYAGGPSPRAVPPLGASTGVAAPEIRQLCFGTYAGLVRQAPAPGAADETHRIRRDGIDRLAALAQAGDGGVDRGAVVPVLKRALSDPSHLVRRSAVQALRALYGEASMEPLALALGADAADVGRQAMDELIAQAQAGHAEARELALGGVDAPNREVRAYAVTGIQKLFDAGSLEPWLVALESQHADVRLSVVHRLREAHDERVAAALERAMESDHEDLRLEAALALARRGSLRTLDVLAGFLRSEDRGTAGRATEGLVTLAHARTLEAQARGEAARAAAEVVAGRLEDDPDKTADRNALVAALGRIGDTKGEDVLLALLDDEDANMRMAALRALLQIARDDEARPIVLGDGTRRARYREPVVLRYLDRAATSEDVSVRIEVTRVCRDVDATAAEQILSKLAQDRDEGVRVAATESLVFRAEHVEGGGIDPLAALLREGRRELVLPAAAGLARRRRPEAFQALLLVFKAGEAPERDRALLALGDLGDPRALEEIEPLVDPDAELGDEDRVLEGTAAEALGIMLGRLESGEDRDRVRATVERLAREGRLDIRQRALTGLRRCGDERSRGILEHVAADALDYADARRHAVQQLGGLGHDAAEPVLASLLDEDDGSLRLAALAALGRIFSDDRTRVSLLALSSRHTDISEPAASFLARRGDADSLVERLAEIRDAGVRQRLRRGLVRRGACPVQAVRQLLAADDPGPRTEGAWLAGAAAASELSEDLARAVERAADDWRRARASSNGGAHPRSRLEERATAWRACLWAASRVGARVIEAARAAIDDAQAPEAVRCEAIRHLAEHGSAEDRDRLVALLSAQDDALRIAAATAFAALDPEEAADVVARLSVADATAVVPVVEAALARAPAKLLSSDVGRRMAAPVLVGRHEAGPLIEAASSGDEGERLVAIAALGREASEAAAKALQSILDDEAAPKSVRAAAFRALRRAERLAQRRARMQEGARP